VEGIVSIHSLSLSLFVKAMGIASLFPFDSVIHLVVDFNRHGITTSTCLDDDDGAGAGYGSNPLV
jgi:hypothetical protein